MSLITKVILQLIMRRVRNKLLSEITVERFGFKKDSGIRNALFFQRIVAEKYIEMQNDIYLAFINYEKTCNKVKHDLLMNDLKQTRVNEKELHPLSNLCRDPMAAISINGQVSNWMPTKKDVRQRYVLSTDLFFLYSENILRRMMYQPNFKINWTPITNIRCADDTVLIENNNMNLQQMFESLNRESEARGLPINKKKTKIVLMSKQKGIPQGNILLNEEKFQ